VTYGEIYADTQYIVPMRVDSLFRVDGELSILMPFSTPINETIKK